MGGLMEQRNTVETDHTARESWLRKLAAKLRRKPKAVSPAYLELEELKRRIQSNKG